MSPATSPWPGRAARPRRAATRPTPPARSGSMPVASRAPMMPDSTSPVPAVARRASPFGDDEDVAARLGDDRGRALEQHDAPQVGGQAAGGARGGRRRAAARRAGRTRRRAGVRTVGARRAAQHAWRPVRRSHASANSPSPSTTTGSAASATVARTAADGVLLAAEAGPDDEGVEAVEVVEHGRRPVERRQPAAHHLGRRRGLDARRRQRHIPAAGPLGRRRRRGGRRRSCPGCRRRRARRATTCAPSAAAAATTTRRRRPRRGAPAPGRCRDRCRRPRRRRRGAGRRRTAGPA